MAAFQEIQLTYKICGQERKELIIESEVLAQERVRCEAFTEDLHNILLARLDNGDDISPALFDELERVSQKISQSKSKEATIEQLLQELI